jgi:hypothetical protein
MYHRVSEASSAQKAHVSFAGFPTSAALMLGGKQISDRSSRESPESNTVGSSTGPKSIGVCSAGSSSFMNPLPMIQPSASSIASSKAETPPDIASPASPKAAAEGSSQGHKRDKKSYTLALLKQPGSHSTSTRGGASSSNVDPNLMLSSCPSDNSDLTLLTNLSEGAGQVDPSNAPNVPLSKDLGRPGSSPSVIRHSSNLQGARLSNSFFASNSVSDRSLQIQVKLKDAAMCTLTLDPPRSHGSALRSPIMVQKLACRSRLSRLAPYLPPEVLLKRQRPKRSADIFAFGMLMWEVYSGRRREVQEADLSDEVFLDPLPKPLSMAEAMAARDQPLELEWPADTPAQYRALAEKCLSGEMSERPNLKSILRTLVQMTD